tara:strand:+ start:8059 stop:8736 length:678 start_codon:yes stop_codon:yes gene_type:complete
MSDRTDIHINQSTMAQVFKLSQPMFDYLWNCIDVAKEKKITKPGDGFPAYELEDPQNLIIKYLMNVLFNEKDNPKMFNFINGEIRKNMEVIARLNSKLLQDNKELAPRLNGLWVNFQKKYEFQPPHQHDGMFSFVIWMDIPYDCEDEKKLHITRPTEAVSLVGNFTFVHSNDNCRSVSQHFIPMSPRMNGYCCFFPSDLCHQVYPFHTSDKERISISGNIVWDTP